MTTINQNITYTHDIRIYLLVYEQILKSRDLRYTLQYTTGPIDENDNIIEYHIYSYKTAVQNNRYTTLQTPITV